MKLLDDNEKSIQFLTENSRTCDENDDAGTADFLIGSIEESLKKML